MEQSLRQLQQELSITDLGHGEAAGYLTYIKSRYPTKVAGDKSSAEHDAEQEEFEESLRSSACAPFTDTIYSQSDSSPDCNESPEGDQDPTVVALSTTSYSGSMFGSPAAILLDNFVLSCGDECSVDYGSYCPSVRNQVDSKGDSAIEVNAAKSELLKEDMVLREIDSLDGEESARDDIETVFSDRESTSSDDDDYELDEELPSRALDTFAAMRNGIDLESDIGADRISVSDVYAFEHEGD